MTAFCVCIPARNEEDRLPRLLDALAAQDVRGPIAVALCVNDSDDRTAAIARDYSVERLNILVDDCRLPADRSHVGTARRRAMDGGLRHVGMEGVLLTTDADCRPPADWIAANLAAIAHGADVVGGRIVVDEDEALDPALATLRTRLDAYWAQVRAIEDAVDPLPHDPAPRHGDHTGASLAIRAATYLAAGGVPPIACGEDRALVAAAVEQGARLVHPMAVWTRTSPRASGRVTGGMADAMAGLAALAAQDRPALVPHFDHWHRRARWRADIRRTAGDAEVVSREAALPPMPCDMPA